MFWFHDVYCLLNLIFQTCTKRNFGKGYAETAKFYRGFCGRNRDGKALVDAVIFYLNMQFPHRSALTFLDRSGLSENHQGGKTGGPLNFRKNRVRREQRLQRALRIQRDRNRWAWNRRVEILRYLCQGIRRQIRIRRQITDIREHIRNCREAMFFHSVQNW
jgi:hypothetical protein